MEKVGAPAPCSLNFMQGGSNGGGDMTRRGEGNLLHFACSYSFVQESKQPQSISIAVEAEAKQGKLTRRVARCATSWAHAPILGEARQRLLRRETTPIRGLLYALPALARGLLSV